jgi:hypothetical protein
MCIVLGNRSYDNATKSDVMSYNFNSDVLITQVRGVTLAPYITETSWS